MAATTASYSWGRPPVLPQSPDTPSSVYPDRPIRPLPKRRIKSRLSEEQAESIVFPPAPPSSSPLFGSPHSQSDRSFVNPHYAGEAHALSDDRDHDHFCDCGDHHSGESDEEDEDRDSAAHRYSWPGKMMKYPREYKERVVSQLKSPPPNSSTSSADGYESFENTNNKKKRKIPVSGALGQSASSDVASMSIPTQSVDVSSIDDHESRTSYGHSSTGHSSGSGIGISGPGRGRYSRSSVRPLSERRPLASSTNAMNAFPNGVHGSPSDKGIISTAIANATETGPIPPPKGQENISLLQRQKQANAVPQNFTFEYKSASSDKLASTRPTVPPPLPKAPPALRTQQGQAPRGQTSANGAPPAQQAVGTQTSQQARAAEQAQPPKPAKPRRPGQALRMAAFRRKEQKRFDNYYNPPKPEDMWICEFCEYQSIFGREPTALIRQYEIKERRERKEREKNRRRLEQAKAKGRKNKKGKSSHKNASNAAGNSNNGASNQRYDPQYDPPHDVDSQGEEYFDDEYDDSGPAPSPLDPEPGAYAAHEYPPPPGVGPVEDNLPGGGGGPSPRAS